MPKCLLVAKCTLQLDGPYTLMGLEIDGPKIFITCEDDKGVKALTSVFLHQI
jgi:hypothetical protein